jgi:hypothetical protein
MLRLAALLSLGTIALGQAFTIDGTEPTVKFNASNSDNPLFDSYKAELELKMNAEVKSAFDSSLAQARANLAGFKEQKELARGFANANAYSVNSATLQGFQNYSLFAVATGLMVGVQAPSASLSYYSKIADDIQGKGDLYAGLGVGGSYLNIGVNAKFLCPGLYLNVKYGALKMEVDDFSMDFSVMGLGVNYRLIEPRSLVGLVKWRGLSVGTGFYLQSDKIGMKVEPEEITTPAHFREAVLEGSSPSDSADKEVLLEQMGYGKDDSDANVILNPVFNMNLDVSTITVPFDAATSLSFFWGLLNVTAGVGFDLNFGSDKIELAGASQAQITSDTTKVTFTDATVTVEGGSKNSPSLTRLRAMTGLGVGLGPVAIDVPLIYYFNSGLALGVTLAVVW